MKALSDKLIQAGSKKGPISSILSLCMVAGIAATLTGLAQNDELPETSAFPVQRTLTSTDGRKLEATILSKTGNAVKIKTAAGKEFTLELSKLSADDQTFIGGVQDLRVATNIETHQDNSKTGFPDGFKFDKTLIKPGQMAFLALPFHKQDKGGICAAASMLNVIQYMEPELKLSQKELFSLLNKRTGGATVEEMLCGLKTLGFQGSLQSTDLKKKELMAKVHRSLDSGRPIMAGKRGHEITLIGYNKTKGTVILWDQRMPDMKDSHGMPVGSFELSESAFRSRIVDLIFIQPNPTQANGLASLQIQDTIGITDVILEHQIYNGNSREESMKDFIRHSYEAQLAVSLRKKHRVFLIDGEKKVIEILAEPKEGTSEWECMTYPDKKAGKVSQNNILRILEESEGISYSTQK